MHNKKILVTGASGTTGITVVQSLLKEGYTVKAVDLPGKMLPPFDTHLEVMRGDISKEGFVNKITEEIDYIVYLAESKPDFKTKSDFNKINLNSLKLVYESAKLKKIKRFIYISSSEIYNFTDNTITNEQSELSAYSKYSRSKISIEDYIMQSNPNRLPHWTIIRPGLIYGPGIQNNLITTTAMVVSIFKKLFYVFPNISTNKQFSLLYIKDFADSINFFINQKKSWGQIYNIADKHPVEFDSIFKTISDYIGLKLTSKSFKNPYKYFNSILNNIENSSTKITVNQYLRDFWKLYTFIFNLENEININIFDLAKNSMCLDVTKINNLGFICSNSDYVKNITSTLDWFNDYNWLRGVK